jgi:cytochrome c oxidase cbb3-type subunit 4
MEQDVLRSIVTVLSFVTFLGIVFWAYSRRRKSGFDQAARSIFDEDEGNKKAVRGDKA